MRYVLLVFLGTICWSMSYGHQRRKKNYVEAVIGIRRNFHNSISWDNAAKYFRDLVMKEFLQSDVANASSDDVFNTTLTSWLLSIITPQQPGVDSLWERRVSKINQRVAEKINDANVEQLHEDINSIIKVMSKAKDQLVSKGDMSIIKAVYPNFYPQSYKHVNFTVKWTDIMTKYLTIISAGYIDLMSAGSFDDCRLAELLNLFRQHIIDAVKKLVKTRYEGLETIGWSGGEKLFKKTAGLTLRDKATGRFFVDIPLSQIKPRILTPLGLQMADFMMKNLVNKLNSLYSDNWIGDSCSLASPITIHDLEFEHPDTCYDADGICKLPCGYYGENKTWCSTNIKTNKWQTGSRDKYWTDCSPPDWEKCMFIEQLEPVVWSGGYDKLKHKIAVDNAMTIGNNYDNDEKKTEVKVMKGPEVKTFSKYLPISDNTEKNVEVEMKMNGIKTFAKDDQDDADVVLNEKEKKQLADVIAAKIKSHHISPQTTADATKRASILEQEKIVETLFVDALAMKKKYGDINLYLEKVKKANELTS